MVNEKDKGTQEEKPAIITVTKKTISWTYDRHQKASYHTFTQMSSARTAVPRHSTLCARALAL